MNSTRELSEGTCQATTRAGVPCRNHALKDESFCVFHSESPAAQDWRNAGRALSGRKPILKRLPSMPGKLNTPQDVLRAVNVLVAAIGERDLTAPNVAALVRLYTLALDTMVGAQAEERIAELERIAEERGNA